MTGHTHTETPMECDWPMTNCYIDLWMGILSSWGLNPVAGLGVTVAQDYEGDQFTFFKFLPEDLELLYGVVVGELSIYGALEDHVEEQTGLGRLVLVEVDGYHLPDTRATSYHVQHVKTTIGIDAMDRATGSLHYFHNTGDYQLSGEDYHAIFRADKPADALPPYVEFVKRRFAPLDGAALTNAAVGLLRRHLRRCPDSNPIRQYRQDFARHTQRLPGRPEAFHDYAFSNFRQLGANFEMLARHADWLGARGLHGLREAAAPARVISATAKSMQFKVARIASRGRHDPCDAMFDTLEQSYEAVIGGLERAVP
jgi:hypothetical protein